MRFEVRTTKDGSLTVFDTAAGECFKSQHAAGLEVEVVFIGPGVRQNPWYGKVTPFRILELGFGLGTNFLALLDSKISAEFITIERDLAGAEFFLAHDAHPELGEFVSKRRIHAGEFSATLVEGDFFDVLRKMAKAEEKFHAIFFDPFSPKSNPEAWTAELFTLAANLLLPNGRLVTYSVSRSAKDSAVAAGLTVIKHKLPDALKKRSAMLATKPSTL